MALVPQPPLFDNLRDLDEETLIKSRLITLELKTFNRVQKRCNTVTSSENLFSETLSSADAGNVEMTDVGTDPEQEKLGPQESIEAAAEKLVEEILQDFAPLEEALMRIQLLTDANRKEVARYEEKKMQIQQASEKARHDMLSLHTSLAEAYQTKRNKLEYDTIATEITTSQNSQKTRQTQLDSIARLNAEIDALESEKADYGKVWAARRGQFGEIVNALMGMQAQIQEDKEEQERREALDDDDGEIEEGEGRSEATETAPTKGLLPGDVTASQGVSTVVTPRGQTAIADAALKEAELKEDADDIEMRDELADDIKEEEQLENTSPRYEEEEEEEEEGEEIEDTQERSPTPTPGPQDTSFNEDVYTEERSSGNDDDMEDDGVVEEDVEGNEGTQEANAIETTDTVIAS